MILEHAQRIVFIGDSITDCDRRDRARPYGDGYVSLVRALVQARHLGLGLTWVNQGISGNTVRDLRRRWETDAIGERPDWLSVMIGINDVWRKFAGQPDEAVPIDEYEATYRELLGEIEGSRLILADPFLIEPDRSDPQRAESDRYAEVVARLAAEFGAIHVRTQAAFDAVLARSAPADWADDRVHPYLPGHAVIAEAYLAALA